MGMNSDSALHQKQPDLRAPLDIRGSGRRRPV
jgi:hypothetical protein